MKTTLDKVCELISSGEIPQEVYNKYLGDTDIGFMPTKEVKECLLRGEWHNIEDEVPSEDGKYLCEYKLFATAIATYNVYRWANDLHEYDDYDFHDRKGECGFFDYDSEGTYYEIGNVTRWKEIV